MNEIQYDTLQFVFFLRKLDNSWVFDFDIFIIKRDYIKTFSWLSIETEPKQMWNKISFIASDGDRLFCVLLCVINILLSITLMFLYF